MKEVTGRPIDYLLVSTPGGQKWIDFEQQVDQKDIPEKMFKWRETWKEIKNAARLNHRGNNLAEINLRYRLFSKEEVLSFATGRVIMTIPWDF